MLLIRTVTELLKRFDDYFKLQLTLNQGIGQTPQQNFLSFLSQTPYVFKTNPLANEVVKEDAKLAQSIENLTLNSEEESSSNTGGSKKGKKAKAKSQPETSKMPRPDILDPFLKNLTAFDEHKLKAKGTWGEFLNSSSKEFMDKAKVMRTSFESLSHFKALILFRLRRQIIIACNDALTQLIQRDQSKNNDNKCIDQELKDKILQYIEEAEEQLAIALVYNWNGDYRPGPGKSEQLLKIISDAITGFYVWQTQTDNDRSLKPSEGAACRDQLPSYFQANYPERIVTNEYTGYSAENYITNAEYNHPSDSSIISQPLRKLSEFVQVSTFSPDKSEEKRNDMSERLVHLRTLLKGKSYDAPDAWEAALTNVDVHLSAINEKYNKGWLPQSQRQLDTVKRTHDLLVQKCPDEVRKGHKCNLTKM